MPHDLFQGVLPCIELIALRGACYYHAAAFETNLTLEGLIFLKIVDPVA